MCILLKLHYAKFDVSSLFCSKVIKEKPLGVGSTALVKEGLRLEISIYCLPLISAVFYTVFVYRNEKYIN